MARNRNTVAIILGLMTATACMAGDEGSSEIDGEDTGDGYSGDPVDTDGDGIPDGDEDEVDNTLPTYPTQHPRIYLTPNRARLEAALNSNTPAASKFRAKVDEWIGGANLWGFQSWNGALLGQLTGNPAYCAKSIAVVEAEVVAAEASIAAGQRPTVALDSYLQIGEMIGDLALVYDWCFDQVTPAQRTRWIAYANQAIWNVWNHTQAKWGATTHAWSGWSVDNPSNNYYYSFLRATMLMGLATKGENPQADEWIAKFRDDKILGQLIPAFNADLVGGASREGTGYGVSMRRLFELYDFWKATTGENLATKTGHTRASMLAFMHQVVPTLDKVAPTGDHARDATAAFFDYHRDYLQELMQLFPAATLSRRAKTLLAESSISAMKSSFMLAYDFLNDNPAIEPMPLAGLNPTYHAKGIGQIYTRSGWDKAATWVNLTAGPYTEEHAHQDQGSLMIYKGGWLAHDGNVHSRSGINQKTTTQGLVRIDSGGAPIKQLYDSLSTVLALAQGDGYVHAAADLTPSYKGNPAIQKVQREMVYLKPDVVVVFDRVQTSPGTTQTWQLVHPVAPAVSGNTATVTNAGHSLKVTRIAPANAAMAATDLRSDSDLLGGYRLDQTVPGGNNRYLNVLSVDGAVTSATASGPTGVTMNLADGRTVSVEFNADDVGGTLTVDGAATPLAAEVETLTP